MIRGLIDKHVKQPSTGFENLLIAYISLDRKNGWSYVRKLVTEPASDFHVRHQCLRAARYFRTERPGVIAEKAILERMTMLIDQADIANIAIDDLRKSRNWEFSDKILSLYTKKDFDIPLIQRSILRYALRCPDAKAARFVADRRKEDPKRVEDVEEILGFEDAAKPHR